MPAMGEIVDVYIEQERMYHFEGDRGVESLCKLVEAIGYRDPQRFGRQANGTYLGSLSTFLADNPGCAEAIVEWIRENGGSEWKDKLLGHIKEGLVSEDLEPGEDDPR